MQLARSLPAYIAGWQANCIFLFVLLFCSLCLGARLRVRPQPIYTHTQRETFPYTSPKGFLQYGIATNRGSRSSNDGMTDCRLVPLLLATPPVFSLCFLTVMCICYCRGSCNPHSHHGGCVLSPLVYLYCCCCCKRVCMCVCEFFAGTCSCLA